MKNRKEKTEWKPDKKLAYETHEIKVGENGQYWTVIQLAISTEALTPFPLLREEHETLRLCRAPAEGMSKHTLGTVE